MTSPGAAPFGGLARRRADQQLAPSEALPPPPSKNLFRLVVVFGTGPNSGFFVYNGSPALGNPPIFAITTASTDPYGNAVTPKAVQQDIPSLFYNGTPVRGSLAAAIAPTATITDAFGNTAPVGTNFGVWDPGTGALKNHFGIDDGGNIYLVDVNNNIRMKGLSSTGELRFFNAFGAVLMLIDPANTLLVFYQDKGSAVQGGTLGGINFSTSTLLDPINAAGLSPGFTSIDPVFGDNSNIAGGIVNLSQAPYTRPGIVTVNGGLTVSTAPFMFFSAPEAGSTAFGIMQLWGQSSDGTSQKPGLVIGDSTIANPLSRLSPQTLEVQGAEFLGDVAAPATPTGGTVVYSATGQLKYVSEDTTVYGTGRALRNATGQTVNSVTPAAITGIGSYSLGIGTYIFRAKVCILQNQAAGAPVLTFAGTITASGRIDTYGLKDGTPLTLDNASSVAAIGGTFTGATFVAPANDINFYIAGTLRVTVAGTFTLQASCTIAIDTFTIRNDGSWMEILPV